VADGNLNHFSLRLKAWDQLWGKKKKKKKNTNTQMHDYNTITQANETEQQTRLGRMKC